MDLNIINNASNHFDDYEFNQDYENNKKFKTIVNSSDTNMHIYNENRLNPDNTSNLKIGEKVFHIKFGTGIIKDIDNDKVEVNFDKAGIKKVIGSYLKNIF